MDADARSEVELPIRIAHAAGDLDAAATAGLELYGDELGRYLGALARTPDDAAEAFSQFCEDMWRGLPAFSFRASFRTWAYTLARNAVYRLGKKPSKRGERNLPISRVEQVSRLVHHVRVTTAAYRRTDMKDGLRALRAQLTPDERELLILRVDRELGWSEIAAVLAGEELSPTDTRKRATALRKRYERLKVRLRDLAEDAGLLPT